MPNGLKNEMKFYSIDKEHKNIILEWFNKPHVKQYYYGEGLQNTLNNIELSLKGINNNGKYTFYHWIAYINDEPFGFLMTSPIEGPYCKNDPYNKWFVEGKNTYTLDLLIGEGKYLGKGLSDKMIINFLLDKYQDADYFLIDPAEDNPKAIHVYEKAGFKKVDNFIPDYDPRPHVMMRLDVKTIKNK